MSDIHITPELLEAVARGEIPPRVLTAVGWNHLLSLCPCCREGFQAWRRERQASPAGYDSVFRLLPLILERHGQEIEEKQEKAARDLHALLRMSHQDRLVKIRRANARFRGVLLGHMLVNEAKKHLPAQPQKVFELAEAAEHVLMRTQHVPGYFEALARARAFMGNARRAAGKLQEADEWIQAARSLVRQESVTDTLIFAELDAIEGVLRKDQRRFRDAEDLLARAVSLYQLAGETIEASRPMLVLGALYHYRQQSAKAIETTEAALRHLDPEREPRLYLCGRHNLALFLTESGRLDTASELLLADEDLYRQFADLWTKLRQAWLKGKIAFGSWRFEEAEQAFLAVRQGFIAQGIGYDAAQVSLDLALLYLKEGRTAEVRQVAEEMLPLFAADDIHPEAIAAMVLFVEAALQETVTAELVTDLADYLKRARENPELRFPGGRPKTPPPA